MSLEKSKMLIASFIEFFAYFMLFRFMVVGIHEWCHLNVLQYFGGNGYIVKNLFGVGVHITEWPINPLHSTVVAFAGGVGVAAIAGIIIILNYYDRMHMDVEEIVALLPVFFAELGYGILEGLYIFTMDPTSYANWASNIYTVGTMAGLLIGMVIYVKYLVDRFS